ncbi:DeoR/GlpR family DNA-binding transcription regulator [Nocardiopsis algeriensis]|uniref:DeoR/GlpR family transcriptional regulator of sugar metabolism n=1 Tax=Nocardiopsis algeriensis TaxID=1478215 RepID=A0A841IWE7_9ACTN|nr:DeoR/GlpR family DNA-binding transcription regulator [Nocardiopsis algeriensis]MBB6120835.1 DeoR/GlpR family transcriptional regulator of sugar metabolism [Nocardiopsis algeriensis]
MLAAQRQERILEQLRRTGGVRVADLVESLAVSDMTVRRDLDALESRGALRKVHGGAVATARTEEPGFEAKSARHEDEKHAIARAVAGLVVPHSAVGLSAGTTTATVARYLVDVPGLTVVTNSLHVAEVFHRAARPDRTVALTGGFRTPSDALVGPLALASIRGLNLDTLVLGVHGMHERAGFTTPNLTEAETDRALVESTATLVVAADHSKWGTVGLSTIAPLERCDVLVTDSGIGAQARTALAERVGRLEIAEVRAGERRAGA